MAGRTRMALGWMAAIPVASVFLVAGLWKLIDPAGAAARLAQAKVPESMSLVVTLALGVAETSAGAMLLLPRFRRWGAVLSGLLLTAFMVFIGVHYAELRGADCSCFPWIRRSVGPGFFAGDGVLLILALVAGMWAGRSRGVRGALTLFAAVAIFAGVSYGLSLGRHAGTKAPDTIAGADGQAIDLRRGKVFLFFFNPQCMHCLEAGRKLAALDWGDTRLIGVPTENPRFAEWFLGKAGLLRKASLSTDAEKLKAVFPFGDPPAGFAIQDGYEKASVLQFDENEARAVLAKLSFAR